MRAETKATLPATKQGQGAVGETEKLTPKISISVDEEGLTTVLTQAVKAESSGPGWKASVGTDDTRFIEGLIGQVFSVGVAHNSKKEKEAGPNFMLSFIRDIEPKDTVESTLAAQMAATHMATMKMAERLAGAQFIETHDAAERALNRLARTFTKQVEALKRYRTGGQQKVTVEHVTVNDGGQAIVGTVNHPRGGDAGKK